MLATAEKVDIHLLAGGLEVRTILDQLVDLDVTKNFLTVLSTGEVIGPSRVPPDKSLLDFRFGGGVGGGGGGGSGGETPPADDKLAGGSEGSLGSGGSGHSGPSSSVGPTTGGGSAHSSVVSCFRCTAPGPVVAAPGPIAPGPIVGAPGPIAGAGVSGLVLVGGGIVVWARRRLREHLAAIWRAMFADKTGSKPDPA